jgi:putative nucleotidyltransferase with HDIG domain
MGAFKDFGGAVSLEDFWKHSIYVATATQVIAEKKKVGEVPEEAFLEGLLHDIGQIILGHLLPEDYAKVLSSSEFSLVEREKKILGVDHAEVGALLMEHWNLPDNFSDVAKNHHNIFPDGGSKSVHLNNLRFAEVISIVCGNSKIENFTDEEVMSAVKGQEFSGDDYNAIFGEVKRREVAMEIFLNIRQDDDLSKTPEEDSQAEQVVALIGTEPDRLKWSGAIIRNLGYSPVEVSYNLKYFEKLDPVAVLVDPNGINKLQFNQLMNRLGDLGKISGIIAPEGNLARQNIDSLSQKSFVLPFAFSQKEFEKLLEKGQ